MWQTHVAGERLFVDYAGDGLRVVIDRLTGKIRKAHMTGTCAQPIRLAAMAGDNLLVPVDRDWRIETEGFDAPIDGLRPIVPPQIARVPVQVVV